MITTIVDTQAIVAGNGGQSTPVKLTLHPSTERVSLQMKVTTTRATAHAVTHEPFRPKFNFFSAYSPEDLTLATVDTSLRYCAKSEEMTLNPDLAIQRQQMAGNPNGQYGYFWFQYPRSEDAYSVVLTATEFNDAGTASSTPITVQVGPTSYTDASGAIAAGGTSQALLAANANRRYLLIQNLSTEDMYVNFGAAAVANSNSVRIFANGGSYEPLVVSNQAVNIISATTGSKFVTKEG